MKLNVGSGQFPASGWVNIEANIDTALEHGADLVVSFKPDELPFKRESFDAIYCGHVLEHILWEDLRPYLEGLWHLLKPGGAFCVVGPDIYRAREGGYSDELIHRCYGEPSFWDGTGWPHVWTCTEQTVVNLLREMFVSVEAVDIRNLDRSWPTVSRAWWQCAVTARKQG